MKTKRLMMTVIGLVLTTMMAQAQSVVAFLADSNGDYTNVRNAPKGKIVTKLGHDSSLIFVLDHPKNGWWRIVGNSYEIAEEGKDVKLKGSKTGYWIHASCVGFGTRNYGGQKLTLRKSPSNKAAVTYSFNKEIILHPLEVHGAWVKVMTGDGKHTGWIEDEWICANPLTNCC
jgi:hypothetical protein